MATSKKKPIRIGIWGIGRAGFGMHCKELDLFPDEFKVVAGCDDEPDRLKRLTDRYPEAKTYTDGDKFLADKNIELVAVAVRSLQHVDYACRALAAGKFVFLEKPIAVSAKGLKLLEEANKQYPGKLFFRHNRRFEACFNHVMEIIHSGVLGEIFEIKLCRHKYQFRGDWQTVISCGGGQLNNWGPHLIDHGLRFLESPLESVWSDLKKITSLGDAEDHLKIVMKGQNQRIVDIEISDAVSLPSPVYAVYGTRGSLVSEDEQDIKLNYLAPEMKFPTAKASTATPGTKDGFGSKITPKWVRKTIMVEPANGLQMTDIYHALFQSIRGKKPYPIKPEEAFEVVRTTLLIKKQNPKFKSPNDQFGK